MTHPGKQDLIHEVSGIPLSVPLHPDDLRGESASNARSRFFNAWWTHYTSDLELRLDSPLYNVTCADDTELKVAQALQPPFVRATFRLAGEVELVETSDPTPTA